MFELILNMPLVTSYFYQKWFSFRNFIFFEDSYKLRYEYKDNF